MGRHAYLIMCHSNWEILEKLIALLDDSRNDIYVHIDRKVKNASKIKHWLTVQNATLTFTKRISVNWGGFSQVKAELILLKAATQTEHDYYHLLSGVDLPLKDQNRVHRFFFENQGKEFIDFDPPSEEAQYESRIRYYRFFQDIIGRRTDVMAAVLRRAESLSLRTQACLKIDRRSKHKYSPQKGSQWFSITHALAVYILSREHEIVKMYQYGLGVDEMFLQTFAAASPHSGNIVSNSVRFIDWKRGSPYTFRSEDFDELMASDKMFARKFDFSVDSEIVEKICAILQNPSSQQSV